MPAKPLAALLVLGAIWGGSFMFMRVAAPEFGVVPLVFIRTLLAAVVLLPFVIFAKALGDIKRFFIPIVVVGIINTALPFALFNYSSLYLQAGVNAILNATAPMFGSVIAFFWFSERMSRSAIWGIVLGFFGVCLISANKALGAQMSLLPIFAALIATFCYGLSASFIKRYLSECKPLALATGSQIAASVVLLIPAWLALPMAMPSDTAWFSALVLAIAGTGIAYLLYFYLISEVGPSRAIIVGYLVPLFGVIWGTAFLSEQLSMQDAIGGTCILIGVMAATGMRLKWFSRPVN